MICYKLQISLVLLFLLLLILKFSKQSHKKTKETFYYNTNLEKYGIFNQPLNKIYEVVYGKYIAKNTDEGYKIKPDNAADLNKTLGFPQRRYNLGKNKSWKKNLEQTTNKQNNEVIDILEFVPIIWFFQDKLFSEYREFFNKVECLKYYFNIFKTSRDFPKNAPLEWHEDNCDITLDLNDSIPEGDTSYFGLDGITSKMKMSSMGS